MTPEDLRLLAAIYTEDLRLWVSYPGGRLEPVEWQKTEIGPYGIIISGTAQGHPYYCRLRHKNGSPLGLLKVEHHGRRDGKNILRVLIRIKVGHSTATVVSSPQRVI